MKTGGTINPTNGCDPPGGGQFFNAEVFLPPLIPGLTPFRSSSELFLVTPLGQARRTCSRRTCSILEIVPAGFSGLRLALYASLAPDE